MQDLKVKTLIDIINSYLNLDITSKIKTDELVKGRAICYIILREQCHMSYTNIGKAFLKNHATILHSVKEFPWMLRSDRDLNRNYQDILAIWTEESFQPFPMSEGELKKELQDLRNQNKLLNLSVINVQEQLADLQKTHKNKWKRYSSIIELIENRLPEHKLVKVEQRINSLINGL